MDSRFALHCLALPWLVTSRRYWMPEMHRGRRSHQQANYDYWSSISKIDGSCCT